MLPAVEYLYDTAPQGASGLSAHDISCGWSITSAVDRLLVPFRVPPGLPETDAAAKLFTSFRELYGVFTRASREQGFRDELRRNQHRYDRTFEVGDTVFRRVPRGARLPKHIFPEPSTGPYAVVEQRTPSSIVLKDPATGSLVGGGANIPLDQILAGPRRARLPFAEDEETEMGPISKLTEGTMS